MLRSVREWLAARCSREEGEADEPSDDGRFVPSILDTSVRYAHGGRSGEVEREIAEIEEEARELEQQREQ